ncbi:Raftlin [Pteropus alecto]|nr:Raftlin [Pteropus alecto]
MHSRQMRKSKGKLSARDKRQAEENEKNLEDQFSKAGDVGNCVLSQQQEEGASEEMKVQEVTGKQLCSDSRCCVENGPAGHCGAPEGGCEGHSGPGDDAREGGAEEVAAEPETAEDN